MLSLIVISPVPLYFSVVVVVFHCQMTPQANMLLKIAWGAKVSSKKAFWWMIGVTTFVVGGIAGTIKFGKDIETIRSETTILWQTWFSKPEIIVRDDISLTVAYSWPHGPPPNKVKDVAKDMTYEFEIDAVIEKKTEAAIPNCTAEVRYNFGSLSQRAKEFSELRRGQYDQIASYKFAVKPGYGLEEIKFRVVCDGVVSKWHSMTIYPTPFLPSGASR